MKEGHLRQFVDIIEHTGKNNGICLTLSDYHLPHTLYVPNVPKDLKNGNAALRPDIVVKAIDWKEIFNQL